MGDTVSDLERKNLLASAPGALPYETISDLRLRQYKSADTVGRNTLSDFEKKYIEGNIPNEALSDTLYDLRRKNYLRQKGLSEPQLASTDDLHLDVENNPAAAGSISIVGDSYLMQSSSSTTITANIPAGGQIGDTLYAVLINTDTSAGSVVTPTTTGWTVVTALANQGTMQRALYSAPWSAGLAPITWAASVARPMGYMVILVRGSTQAPVVSLFNESSATVNNTFPAGIATKAGIALRIVCRKDTTSTGVTTPAGHTLIRKAFGTTAPAAHAMACQIPAPVGALSSASAIWTVSSLNSTSWTILVA